MMSLGKIETKTQEVVFLGTVLLSVSLVLGTLFYIYLNPDKFISLTGSLGGHGLKKICESFGLGVFILSWGIFTWGQYTIRMFPTFVDIKSGFVRISLNLVAKIYIAVLVSTYLVIGSKSLKIAGPKNFGHGIGGIIGEFLGGLLFVKFGIYGSLLLLTLLVMVVGVISGRFHLVNAIYEIQDVLGRLKAYTFNGFREIYSRLNSGYVYEAAVVEERLPHEMRAVQLAERRMSANTPVEYFTEEKIPQNELVEEIEEIAETVTVKEAPKKKVTAKKETPKKKTTAKKKLPKSPEVVNEEESTEEESIEEESAEGLNFRVKVVKKAYPKADKSLLKKPVKYKQLTAKQIAEKSKELEERLESFNVSGKVENVYPGIRLTMFEVKPDVGVKVSKFQALSDDLALLLGASSIRILAPIPGKSTIGIEIPNKSPGLLTFSELLPGLTKDKKMALPVAMGKDVYNEVITSDLAKMPHLLVSGTTGSGKSVFINSLVCSLLFSKSPRELQFLMIDPKMIELTPYNGLPHMLQPVITNVEKAKDMLVWAEQEMDRRYEQLAELGAKNIESFNTKIKGSSKKNMEKRIGKEISWNWDTMPYIVIIVDELADLMITQGKEVEIPITRIAQKARACGIHMVLATQRPSSDIVTGLIKTNFPTRVAFKVSSNIDSRTILDQTGAEKLLGNGDMLVVPNGKTVQRMQASFLSEEEVVKVVKSLKK